MYTLPKPEVKNIPHIVLALDDAEECMLFINALTNLHAPYFFSVAKNGEMLLSMLDKDDFHPDFIFLDLQILENSGEACLERLKTRKNMDSVRVILFSTSGNPDDKDYCYNTRANEYCLKALTFLL